MRIKEIMKEGVHLVTPDQSIREAAVLMDRIDAGSLPVAENDRLVGMITDRDIAMRAVGGGKSPDTPIREIMSTLVKYCFEDEELAAVVDNIREVRLRRLPVLNRDKRLVGIVSLGDISERDEFAAGHAIRGIAAPDSPMQRTA